MVGGHEEGALLARGHAVERIEQAREGDLVGVRVRARVMDTARARVRARVCRVDPNPKPD